MEEEEYREQVKNFDIERRSISDKKPSDAVPSDAVKGVDLG